jgi:hypothetical protein
MQRNIAGYALIEAIVAAGLLVTVALGATQLFGVALAQSLSARQMLVMGLAAWAKVDELSTAIAAGAVAISPADALDRDVSGSVDTVVESGRAYRRRWRIAEVPGYGAEAYSISVRVLPAVGVGPELRLATIRAAGGP